MAKNYFITGTDTDAGKTLITEALLLKAQQAKFKTIGMKPVAAGAEYMPDGSNAYSDAYKIRAASTEKLDYQQVNPILLDLPIAPHIAASKQNRRLSAKALVGFIRGFMLQPADLRLIEGAGGWYVPLNDHETMADVVKNLKLDVILVIGLKLGCLNHALLSAQAISREGLNIVGWVGTQVDPEMAVVDENIETLRHFFASPCLGIVPYIRDITAAKAAEYLTLPKY